MIRWSLRARLTALALGASLVTAAIGSLALWSNDQVAGKMKSVQEQRLEPLVSLDIVGRALERQRASVLATLAATNDLMVEALEKQAAADAAGMPPVIAKLRSHASDGREIRLLDALAAALAKSRDVGLKEVLARLRTGQFIEADVAAQSLYRPQMEALSMALDQVILLQVELAHRDYQDADGLVRRQAMITIGATVLALLLGMGFASLVARALQRVLGAHELDLAHGARLVAEGKLGHRVVVGAGGHNSVAANLNRMSEGVSSLVAGVATSAGVVADASERFSSASHDLSVRSAGQAASLEETAASMQQLAVAVERNNAHAERAREMAGDAARVAARGGEAMSGVVATMRTISESSRRIGEIAAAVDGIAFQTNILALNAAVEAARAGEQGRGFAVVAAEVRSLSQRSAAAAGEIRSLAGDTLKSIDLGRLAVDDARLTMEGIVTSTGEAAAVVKEIADSSIEQSSGIVQVNRALEHLESVTQRNAALAEQTASDAHEMAAQARGLVDSVARFSLGDAQRKIAQPIGRPLPAPRPRADLRVLPLRQDGPGLRHPRGYP